MPLSRIPWWCAIAWSCASTAPAPQPPAAPEPVSNDIQAPIRVRVTADEGALRKGATLPVQWSVERLADLGFELDVSVRIPAGVKASGELAARVPSAVGMTTGMVRLELPGGPPADDLVVIVSGRHASAGYHAEAPYRFGRPEPVDSGPEKQGPDVRSGDVRLGPGVLMK